MFKIEVGRLPDTKKLAEELIKECVARARRARCPEHNECPQNLRVRKSATGPEIEADVCCEKLRDKMTRAFVGAR